MTGRLGFRSPGAWLGLGVSLVCLSLAFRDVNIGAVLAALSQTNLWLVVAAFIAVMLSTAGSTIRWRALLFPYRPHLERLFQVFMISHLGNTLLPWKLGTFLRTYLVADTEDIALSFVIGTVAVERLLDTSIVAVLFLAIVPVMALPRWLHDSGLGISLTILPLFLMLIIAIYIKPHLLTGFRRYNRIGLPGPLEWLTQIIKQGLRSLDILARPGQYMPIVLWSMFLWIAGALANEFALRAMNIHVPMLTSVLLLVTLQIGSKAPAAPANLGVFHYVVVLTLGLFDVDKAAALSYAFVLHTVVFLAPAIIGGLCLWTWQRDFGGNHFAKLYKRIRTASQESAS